MKWAKFRRKSIDKATGQTDQYRQITASPPEEPPRCNQKRRTCGTLVADGWAEVEMKKKREKKK